jgi:hypothetical protein
MTKHENKYRTRLNTYLLHRNFFTKYDHLFRLNRMLVVTDVGSGVGVGIAVDDGS